MTRKGRRLLFALAGMASLGLAAALVLVAAKDNLVYFYTPSEILEKNIPENRRIRIGGIVEEGSVRKEGTKTYFLVTDMTKSLSVIYEGVLPDLFREGQGVVTEGKINHDGFFIASEVLAKHDEKYMPKEVADALKKSGRWQEQESKR